MAPPAQQPEWAESQQLLSGSAGTPDYTATPNEAEQTRSARSSGLVACGTEDAGKG